MDSNPDGKASDIFDYFKVRSPGLSDSACALLVSCSARCQTCTLCLPVLPRAANAKADD